MRAVLPKRSYLIRDGISHRLHEEVPLQQYVLRCAPIELDIAIPPVSSRRTAHDEGVICGLSSPRPCHQLILARVPPARQANGVFNPAKLMGVTTLDVARAKTFVAESQSKCSVVVVVCVWPISLS